MTKKQKDKEMVILESALKDKEIKIWFNGSKKEDDPDLEGTFVRYSRTTPGNPGMVYLKHVLMKDGHWIDEFGFPVTRLRWFDTVHPYSPINAEITIEEKEPGVTTTTMSFTQVIYVTPPKTNLKDT